MSDTPEHLQAIDEIPVDRLWPGSVLWHRDSRWSVLEGGTLMSRRNLHAVETERVQGKYIVDDHGLYGLVVAVAKALGHSPADVFGDGLFAYAAWLQGRFDGSDVLDTICSTASHIALSRRLSGLADLSLEEFEVPLWEKLVHGPDVIQWVLTTKAGIWYTNELGHIEEPNAALRAATELPETAF